jgi:hypothetical protein
VSGLGQVWHDRVSLPDYFKQRRNVMLRSNFILSGVLILAALFAVGCAGVSYVGNSFDPTTTVDVYFSENEIEKEYTVMGHALGTGQWVSIDKIQTKLIEEAKGKGADAILIRGLGKSHVPIGDDTSIDEDQINASFLKYK